MVVGQNDFLVAAEDYKQLMDVLPDNAEYLYLKDYNHVDALWAKDQDEYLYLTLYNFFVNHKL